VEALLTPEAFAIVPPVPIPVIVIVPVEALFAPFAFPHRIARTDADGDDNCHEW
jgi:hypothetical protein